MKKHSVYQCHCSDCQGPTENPIKELHAQMNIFLSILDERQRRLYVGLEAKKLGCGGDQQMAVITGLSVNTISKGRHELEQAEPSDRIRVSGGGRHRVEKKTQPL